MFNIVTYMKISFIGILEMNSQEQQCFMFICLVYIIEALPYMVRLCIHALTLTCAGKRDIVCFKII